MPGMTNRSIEAATGSITVDCVDGQYRVVATRDFEVDDHILTLEGEVVPGPSRFSVQIGTDEHLEVPAAVQIAQPLDRYRWRFLNHSCEPNSKFVGRDLVAIHRIRSSEQITFDYNTTEYDLASPFECHCGSGNCCGVVRGYRWEQGRASAAG